MKKPLNALVAILMLIVVTYITIQNIHAISDIQKTGFMATNIAKKFNPWNFIISIALPHQYNIFKSYAVEPSGSIKYVANGETRDVRTDFDYLHGFKFKNFYTNEYTVIPDKYIPDFIYDGKISFSTQGRCGGMAFAALDYWYAHQHIPGYSITPTGTSQPGNPASLPTPSNDDPLSKYILQRFHDSLDLSLLGILKDLVSVGLTTSPFSSVSSLEEIPRFIYLTMASTENTGTIFGYCTVGCFPGVRPLTDAEVTKATHLLDQKKPVVLGLIAASSIGHIGDNHQVVAYGYHYDRAYDYYTFYIYDSNKPNMEVRASWAHGVHYGSLQYWYQYFDSKKGFVTAQFTDYNKSWRGFFVEDYTPKIPNIAIDMDQDGIEDSSDNCPSFKNADQKDTNNNGVGDVCESGDIDNDGIIDSIDNCKYAANPDQKDEDHDGVGDACKNIIL